MVQVGCCRPRNLSLLWVILLTCSNIILTVRLLGGSGPSAGAECPCRDHYAPPLPALGPAPPPAARSPDSEAAAEPADPPAEEDDPGMPPGALDADPDTITVDVSLGRWDSRRTLKMFDQAMVGLRFSALSEKGRVTLATQTSLERLHSLVQVTHHWTGPLSVALYAAGDEWRLVQAYVRYLRRCFKPVRERVAFHVAFPADRLPVDPPEANVIEQISNVEAKLDCYRPEPSLKRLLRLRRADTFRWRLNHGYPQNHLRNLARKACQTNHVFLVDVDVVPSLGLAQGLDEFLATAKCGPPPAPLPRVPRLSLSSAATLRPPPPQCAYVVPTFELDDRVHFPQNKSDLVRLVGKGLARPFHHKVFIYNQYATNFSRWQGESEGDSHSVHIAYNVTNFEFLYEPFYVAQDTVAPHDERFIGYGYTRNTQVYEMFVSGVQFQVLSPGFTVHWGLQSKQARPAWREMQNNENRRHFEVFKREVAARYRRDPLSMLQPKRNPPRGAPAAKQGKQPPAAPAGRA